MDRGRSAPGGLGAAGSLDGAGEGAGGRWEMGLLGICWETRGPAGPAEVCVGVPGCWLEKRVVARPGEQRGD